MLAVVLLVHAPDLLEGLAICMINSIIYQYKCTIVYYGVSITAPYHIAQPSTDDHVRIVSITEMNVTLRCSLSVNIPANVTITWLHNGRVVESTITLVDQTTNTVQLTRIPQEGVYQCVFNDAVGYILRRNITLLGMYMYVCMYSYILSYS